MTLYKFPSGTVCSDEKYKENFAKEYPSDRPEAAPDYVKAVKTEEIQVCFSDEEEESEE